MTSTSSFRPRPIRVPIRSKPQNSSRTSSSPCLPSRGRSTFSLTRYRTLMVSKTCSTGCKTEGGFFHLHHWVKLISSFVRAGPRSFQPGAIEFEMQTLTYEYCQMKRFFGIVREPESGRGVRYVYLRGWLPKNDGLPPVADKRTTPRR